MLGAWLLRPRLAAGSRAGCSSGGGGGGGVGGGASSSAEGWDHTWLATRAPPVGGLHRKSTPQVRLMHPAPAQCAISTAAGSSSLPYCQCHSQTWWLKLQTVTSQ